MRLSPNPVLAASAAVYIWLFRGTPLIVQLMFWNFLAALYPRLSLGIPFGPDVRLGRHQRRHLGVRRGAARARAQRGRVHGRDRARRHPVGRPGPDARRRRRWACRGTQTLRRIVLPQAMRVIVPPTGNETISMLKTTSLVVVIALLRADCTPCRPIYSRTFQTIPLLIVAASGTWS